MGVAEHLTNLWTWHQRCQFIPCLLSSELIQDPYSSFMDVWKLFRNQDQVFRDKRKHSSNQREAFCFGLMSFDGHAESFVFNCCHAISSIIVIAVLFQHFCLSLKMNMFYGVNKNRKTGKKGYWLFTAVRGRLPRPNPDQPIESSRICLGKWKSSKW